MAPPPPPGDDFARAWNRLAVADRRRVRRLVRIGRPLADPNEAALAVDYAAFQRSRAWNRLFWFWFLPGVLVALGIAATIHPIVIGAVLALATQALFAQRNLTRVEKVNAGVLPSP